MKKIQSYLVGKRKTQFFRQSFINMIRNILVHFNYFSFTNSFSSMTYFENEQQLKWIRRKIPLKLFSKTSDGTSKSFVFGTRGDLNDRDNIKVTVEPGIKDTPQNKRGVELAHVFSVGSVFIQANRLWVNSSHRLLPDWNISSVISWKMLF